ncbi:MAG: NapC/NirT family cytochrome c [bacterium]|nr:NapC/NirT family cytochrome c [bacterium]
MRRAYLAFLRGISANALSQTGAILATSAGLCFIGMELLRVAGIVTNAYVGLITYMALPLLFVVGLLLIPLGWWRWSRRAGRPIRELLSLRFAETDLAARAAGSRVLRTIVLLTLLNLIFISVVSIRTMHFMDQASFCGTACHRVMNPEWTTYQQSPHARVLCVECHVGEGTKALIDAKLNGLWQIISATFHLYEKPIPTPVHNLRPARETCEKCHWPEMFLGERTVNLTHYELDEVSTPRYTTLVMKVGTGKAGQEHGSHWHVAEANEVRYAAADARRMEMRWVEARQPDGSFRRYRNREFPPSTESSSDVRTMDCVDCHNRATHIYEEPERAVDQRMARGLIDRSLPYAKKVALGALMGSYADTTSAVRGIEAHIRGFYREEYPHLLGPRGQEIDGMVETTLAIYRRNIHPYMGIRWGSYPNHLGHEGEGGCFRCHNPQMVDEEGISISMDCTLCHSILAYDEAEPYMYLFAADDSTAGVRRHLIEYLRGEFWEAVKP